jgi:hypothetical protein
MSAKINFFSGLVPAGGGSAVEPTEGKVYVITKVLFKSETDTPGKVTAASPGKQKLVDTMLVARHQTGWEGTYIVEHGERFVVQASPADSIRCVVEGYFLLDVPAEGRRGAGAMDKAYAEDGAIHTQDSKLARMTYLMLVELKRMRAILERGAETEGYLQMDAAEASEEIDRELEQ